MNQPKTRTKLTDQAIALLFDITRYQLLDEEQIRRLHFPDMKPDSVRKKLERLSDIPAAEIPEGARQKPQRGYIKKTYTYSRTVKRRGGIEVAPRKRVWYSPERLQTKLETDLTQLGRSDQYDQFRDFVKSFNKNQSFSDQSLEHELRLSDMLIAWDHAAETNPEIASYGWFRTSPRHDLTRTTVHFEKTLHQGTRDQVVVKRQRPINPDVIAWVQPVDGDVFFFKLEYENNQEGDPYKYREDKLEGLMHHARQGQGREEPVLSTRYFGAVAKELNAMFALGIEHPERAQYRVLTVSISAAQSRKLFMASTAMPTHSLFYFTDIDAFCRDPFEDIWMRKKELAETPHTERVGEQQRSYPSMLDRLEELIESDRTRMTTVRKWLDTVMSDSLPRVVIP